MQGKAADLIELRMLAEERRIRKERWAARMLLQIHDELIFEVPPDEVKAMAELARNEMSHVQKLSIPLKVDVKIGPNWAEAQ